MIATSRKCYSGRDLWCNRPDGPMLRIGPRLTLNARSTPIPLHDDRHGFWFPETRGSGSINWIAGLTASPSSIRSSLSRSLPSQRHRSAFIARSCSTTWKNFVSRTASWPAERGSSCRPRRPVGLLVVLDSSPDLARRIILADHKRRRDDHQQGKPDEQALRNWSMIDPPAKRTGRAHAGDRSCGGDGANSTGCSNCGSASTGNSADVPGSSFFARELLIHLANLYTP